jgi:hypothetical protein
MSSAKSTPTQYLPRWQIHVRPPNDKLMSTMHSGISVFHKYEAPAGSKEHESDPLVINAVRQKDFTLTVFKEGSVAVR